MDTDIWTLRSIYMRMGAMTTPTPNPRVVKLHRVLKATAGDFRIEPVGPPGVYACVGMAQITEAEHTIAKTFGCELRVCTKDAANGILKSWDIGDSTLVALLFVHPPPKRPWWYWVVGLTLVSAAVGGAAWAYVQQQNEWE